ncbi:MAG: 50S ribosomal protein L3 [Parcubacteria group bacterium]|nr:50S ribosomal protein L3 [Parcubacteria group bacterium]
MKYIIGEKLGCTQLISDKGEIIPVTLIGAESAVVTQIKTPEKDGYASVQVASGSKKEKNVNRAAKGHFKGLGNFRFVREFRFSGSADYKVGDKFSLADFSPGEMVKVSSKSSGKGFQGVVKRHGFSGGPASHGHRDVLRKPGSIGGRFPQRVLKGKRMAGRLGGDRVTVKNLEVVKVDSENKVMAVRGAVPGRKGTMVEIRS